MNNSQFDWQAEEHEDLSIPSRGEETNEKKGRLWLVVGVFLLFGIALVLIIRFLGQQQRQLEEDVREDVQASFNLWQKAVKQNDGELYAHLLAVDDWNWRQN